MADDLTLRGELLLTSTGGGEPRVRVDGSGGNAWLGGNGADGDVVMFRSGGDNRTLAQATIHLDGNGGDLWMGGQGVAGNIVLLPGASTDINDASGARVRIDGNGGNVWLGGNGADGDVVMFRSGGDNHTLAQATIHLDGNRGDLWMGGQGIAGNIVLLPGASTDINDASGARVRIDGDGGNLWLGGNGADGDIVLFRSGGDNRTLAQATIHLDGDQANLWMGGKGADGDIVLFPSGATDINDLSQATIHLDAQAGDIKLLNADCAEDFDVAAAIELEPGDVVVIDADRCVTRARAAYDPTVAGVVAGAGDRRLGIVLGRDPSRGERVPVALFGRVYVKADASRVPIRVGDLLTTSDRPGHAMAAHDRERAFGAVIGKALQPLDEGLGLIEILAVLH